MTPKLTRGPRPLSWKLIFRLRNFGITKSSNVGSLGLGLRLSRISAQPCPNRDPQFAPSILLDR